MSDDDKIVDLRRSLRPAPDPDSFTGTPEEEPRPRGEIWRDCPVQALGVWGDICYYLDLLGQLRAVDNHTKDKMRTIFGGRIDWLMSRWPTMSRDSNSVTGWSQEKAAAAMVQACTDRGVWDAEQHTRGRGAWLDEDGGLMLHCGDGVLSGGKWLPPGRIGAYVYPSATPTARPLAEMPKSGPNNPAVKLLQMLETWNWDRKGLDAYLMLGFIMAAIVGGALDWRSMVWLTGDAGTGKSTLHKLVQAMLSDGWLIYTTESSEAGVRQQIDQSSVPVLIDEAEPNPNDNNGKIGQMINLARQAASGGVVLRGGSDHKGRKFQARSSFMFSSILVPGLLDQDIQRIALLRLNPLPKDQPAPKIVPSEWRTIRRGLMSRLVTLWPLFTEILETYRAAMARAGHSARGQDQIGTLFAMAHLALNDGAPTAAEADVWASRMPPSELEDAGMSDWKRMINHLLSSDMPGFRGGMNHSVGAWIDAAAMLRSAESEHGIKQEEALTALRDIGISIKGVGPYATVTLANCHSRLAKLFEGTHWSGGSGRNGVWKQAAERIPGAKKIGPTRFGSARVQSRSVMFPLKSLEEDAPPEQEAPREAPEFGPDDFS